VIREVEKDSRVAGYLQQLDAMDLELSDLSDGVGKDSPAVVKLERRKKTLQKKADDRIAELLAATRQSHFASLQNQLETAQEYAKSLNESIDEIKSDLGDLTNAMAQYLTLKDEEQSTRELLRQVNQQLDRIANVTDSRILEETDVLKEFDRFLIGGLDEPKREKR
jgi:uncharacterized protein involved in exopolysaccharide biosynthesis